MKPLGDCLLSKSGTLLGEGVSGFEIEKKSNVAACVIGAVSKQKSRVEKVQMREWEEER